MKGERNDKITFRKMKIDFKHSNGSRQVRDAQKDGNKKNVRIFLSLLWVFILSPSFFF